MGKNTNTKKLTDQQERFCLEYIVDLNATQAAIRAGYSKKTAEQLGYQLLQKPSVVGFIETLKIEREKRVLVKADDVLIELMRLGYADVGDLMDDKGRMLPIKQLPKDIRRAIQSFDICVEHEPNPIEGGPDIKVERICNVRFWNKERALELLGKHKKLYTDKLELGGTVTLESLVTGSMESDDEK